MGLSLDLGGDAIDAAGDWAAVIEDTFIIIIQQGALDPLSS